MILSDGVFHNHEPGVFFFQGRYNYDWGQAIHIRASKGGGNLKEFGVLVGVLSSLFVLFASGRRAL